MLNQPYVYIYSDPQTGTPFYVGKGTGRRYKEHLQPSKLKRTYPLASKLRRMLSEGVQPQISQIFTSNEGFAFSLEVGLIRHLGKRCDGTGPLLNLSDGGEGATGIPNKHKGVSQPVWLIEKRAAALRGKKKSPEHIQAIVASKKEKHVKKRWVNNGNISRMIPLNTNLDGFKDGRL